MSITNEEKDKLTEALRQGMTQGYETSRGRALAWWERLIWVVLAGIAAAASTYLTACTASYSQSADGAINAAIVIVPVEEEK